MADAVHQLQPRFAIEGLCLYAELAEVVQQIQFDAFQTGLGGFVGIRFNPEGQVFLFLQAVVALGKLAAQHVRILGADAVKVIVLRGNVDALFKDFRVCRQIEEAELEVNRRVEVIQKIAPAVKERLLVLVLCKLVVDILKLNRPRIARICDAADAVRVHALIGNGFLRGMRRFLTVIRFPDFGTNQLLFLAGELFALLLFLDLGNVLLKRALPFQCVVQIFTLIRALFRAQERSSEEMLQHDFQRFAVLLVYAQQDKRHHDQHHDERRDA